MGRPCMWSPKAHSPRALPGPCREPVGSQHGRAKGDARSSGIGPRRGHSGWTLGAPSGNLRTRCFHPGHHRLLLEAVLAFPVAARARPHTEGLMAPTSTAQQLCRASGGSRGESIFLPRQLLQVPAFQGPWPPRIFKGCSD